MSVLEKSSKYNYYVEPFQEDFTGKLSWVELGNRILAVAAMHANSHEFGMKQIFPNNMSWVLSRFIVEMDEMPLVEENYSVATWIRSVYRTFTDRCFSITRPDGKVLGYAYSIWAMINTQTRTPVNIENLPEGGLEKWLDTELVCNTSPFSRIQVKNTEPDRIITARYSDIDVNQHVNSIRYIQHVLDLFPAEMFKLHPLKRMEAAYHSESYYGNKLGLYKHQVDELTYDVEVRVLPEEGSDEKEKKAVSLRFTFA